MINYIKEIKIRNKTIKNDIEQDEIERISL